MYQAGQVFTVATFALMLSGTLARQPRAVRALVACCRCVALPLLYNHIFLLGMMNYLFGIGLALWGMALWLWLRDRFWPLRFLVSTGVVLVLFFCHLSAAGLYGLGLLAIELCRLWSGAGAVRLALADFVATGLPFVPVLPLLMKSPTWGSRASSAGSSRARSTA